MSKHTPGPWLIRAGFIFGPEEQAIGQWHDWGDDTQDARAEAGANARLIAAAPQLLEALEALHTIYVREGAAVTPAAEIGEAWMRATGVLKAAKGEA